MADAVGFAKGRAKEEWQNMASLFLCHADHTWPACFPCHAANANWPSRGKWHIRRARSLTTDDITNLWKLGLWFSFLLFYERNLGDVFWVIMADLVRPCLVRGFFFISLYHIKRNLTIL